MSYEETGFLYTNEFQFETDECPIEKESAAREILRLGDPVISLHVNRLGKTYLLAYRSSLDNPNLGLGLKYVDIRGTPEFLGAVITELAYQLITASRNLDD